MICQFISKKEPNIDEQTINIIFKPLFQFPTKHKT